MLVNHRFGLNSQLSNQLNFYIMKALFKLMLFSIVMLVVTPPLEAQMLGGYGFSQFGYVLNNSPAKHVVGDLCKPEAKNNFQHSGNTKKSGIENTQTYPLKNSSNFEENKKLVNYMINEYERPQMKNINHAIPRDVKPVRIVRE
jgi:hypothetical protein